MKRRRLTAAELLARLPRGLTPKLSGAQKIDLAICHHINHDAIVRGQAGTQIMWDYVESVLAWWKVADLLAQARPDMTLQLGVATRLVEHYGRSATVQFVGHDIELARRGLMTMDQLADLVDQPTAVVAVMWARGEFNSLTASSPSIQEANVEAQAA